VPRMQYATLDDLKHHGIPEPTADEIEAALKLAEAVVFGPRADAAMRDQVVAMAVEPLVRSAG